MLGTQYKRCLAIAPHSWEQCWKVKVDVRYSCYNGGRGTACCKRSGNEGSWMVLSSTHARAFALFQLDQLLCGWPLHARCCTLSENFTGNCLCDLS